MVEGSYQGTGGRVKDELFFQLAEVEDGLQLPEMDAVVLGLGSFICLDHDLLEGVKHDTCGGVVGMGAGSEALDLANEEWVPRQALHGLQQKSGELESVELPEVGVVGHFVDEGHKALVFLEVVSVTLGGVSHIAAVHLVRLEFGDEVLKEVSWEVWRGGRGGGGGRRGVRE